MMIAITIRNLSDEVSRALEARAAENGTSAEAEAESILRETSLPHATQVESPVSKTPPDGLGTALRQLREKYGPLEDVDFSRDQTRARGASFE
jgi:plasmid stability protein